MLLKRNNKFNNMFSKLNNVLLSVENMFSKLNNMLLNLLLNLNNIVVEFVVECC